MPARLLVTADAAGRPLRFGVLGCAEFAWRRALPALAAGPHSTVVAVAGRDPGRAARFAGRFGAEPVHGYAPLLERADVDAVYLPLPPALHAEWVDRALLAGKHVLCEKPLAPDPADAARLVASAARRGLVLAENYMFVKHGLHDAVRKLVADGAVGDVRAVTAVFAMPPRAPDDIRYQPALGGGALGDNGGYPIRLAQSLLGPRLTVAGASLRVDPAYGVDVGGAALLVTPDGVVAQVAFGMEHGYRCAYEVWGSRGRIVVERAFTAPPTLSPVVRLDRQDRVEKLTLPPDDQFAAAIAAFAGAVRDGTDSGLQGDVVVRQAELVDEVRRRAVRSRA
ncbi:Gfo/Idh/MocA family protein [Virgisporangium aurantiacum]|uniref:Oxidoreductase n=1 Tax=Virgisporangium aurantiacum TaxID=175570 RepID=A0A8J3ZEZ4_9ACTN|nr:Gfo/Idh/MocA family oxidoreductase [Virgisporangium aurantiacum]GIJ60381.1 oxidoreductase [Virgisporangium aurantiacum]